MNLAQCISSETGHILADYAAAPVKLYCVPRQKFVVIEQKHKPVSGDTLAVLECLWDADRGLSFGDLRTKCKVKHDRLGGILQVLERREEIRKRLNSRGRYWYWAMKT